MIRWKKSSRSGGGNGANCVEVAQARQVLIRDSKDPAGGVVTVSAESWQAFLATLTHHA
jgi:hypothetical protein